MPGSCCGSSIEDQERQIVEQIVEYVKDNNVNDLRICMDELGDTFDINAYLEDGYTNGYTLVCLAVRHASHDVLTFFIEEHGANVRKPTKSTEYRPESKTPLYIAAEYDDLVSIQIILDADSEALYDESSFQAVDESGQEITYTSIAMEGAAHNLHLNYVDTMSVSGWDVNKEYKNRLECVLLLIGAGSDMSYTYFQNKSVEAYELTKHIIDRGLVLDEDGNIRPFLQEYFEKHFHYNSDKQWAEIQKIKAEYDKQYASFSRTRQRDRAISDIVFDTGSMYSQDGEASIAVSGESSSSTSVGVVLPDIPLVITTSGSKSNKSSGQNAFGTSSSSSASLSLGLKENSLGWFANAIADECFKNSRFPKFCSDTTISPVYKTGLLGALQNTQSSEDTTEALRIIAARMDYNYLKSWTNYKAFCRDVQDCVIALIRAGGSMSYGYFDRRFTESRGLTKRLIEENMVLDAEGNIRPCLQEYFSDNHRLYVNAEEDWETIKTIKEVYDKEHSVSMVLNVMQGKVSVPGAAVLSVHGPG